MQKKQFIDLLRCPETRQTLEPIDEEMLSRLNLAIREGKIKNRVGYPIVDSMDAGLIRHDGQVIYPIKEDIPILLTDEGISINQLTTTT